MPNPTDCGPAFPTQNEGQIGPSTYHYEGMSLRDYFAGQALAGLCASACDSQSMSRTPAPQTMANRAYAYADAMLAHRTTKEEDHA
jgi:hypothetical protein